MVVSESAIDVAAELVKVNYNLNLIIGIMLCAVVIFFASAVLNKTFGKGR